VALGYLFESQMQDALSPTGALLLAFFAYTGPVVASFVPRRLLIPRKLRGFYRYSVYILFFVLLCLVFAIGVTPLLQRKPMSYDVKHDLKPLLPLAISLCALAYVAFRRPSAKEALRNYAADPRHCGRCEYDLTGNVSGICPECGWAIPKTLPRVEGWDWPFWWKNWQETLTRTAIYLVAFTALTIWLLFRTPVSSLVWTIPAPTAVHLGINALRITQYGRQRQNEPLSRP